MNKYETYKDSGVQWLGKIPSHWDCVRLKNLGTCQNGVSKGGDYFGDGFPFVSYSDAYKNKFSLQQFKVWQDLQKMIESRIL